MRAKWRDRVLVVGSLCLAGAGDALANGHHGRGAYVAEPTAYVVETVPTAYVLPTAYNVPSVYALETSYVPYAPAYVPSSYILSPSYSYVTPTTYRRYVARGFRVPRNYVTTSGIFPTVFETQAVSNSCDPCAVMPPCCDPGTSPTLAATPTQEPQRSSVPPGELQSAPRPTTSSVESAPAPAPEPAGPTTAEPTVRRETSPAPSRPPARGAVDPNFSTPPDTPAHEKEVPTPPTPATIQSTPITPAPAGEKTQPKTKTQPQPAPTPPVAPGAEESALDIPAPAASAGEGGAVRHDVQKPAGPPAYLRSVRKGDLHKLEGRVISTETGRPEEGVRVTIANRGNTFVDRVAVSDAFGRYAFTLPDGEWTVNVTMPSGRSYPVSQLRVANGQINDDLGREIPSLMINR